MVDCMRRALLAVASALVASLTLSVPVPAHAATPDLRVFMVSDSVGLGAKTAMPKAFPAGWQVTVTGKPALFVEQLVSQYVTYQPTSVIGDHAIVAGGYNYPYWDPARFDRSIDLMISELLRKGAKRVFWVTLREVKPQYITASAWQQVQPYYWYFPRVNQHLRDALARHPQLSLIDWASIADRSGLTYDAIHLNTTGATEYSALAAATVLSGATRRPAGTVSEIVVPGVDDGNGGTVAPLAVALQTTVVNPRTSGFVSAYPCDVPRPAVAMLNFQPALTTGAQTVVAPSADGRICVYQSAAAHVVVDLAGTFDATAAVSMPPPSRALDSRNSPLPPVSQPFVVRPAEHGVAADAAAVLLGVTTIGGFTAGDVFVHPCAQGPGAAPTRTTAPGVPLNNLVVVAADAAGEVCIRVTQPSHVIVDVLGSFAAGSDIHPLAPQRIFDTRFLSAGLQPAGTVLALQIGHIRVDPSATAVIVTAGSTFSATRGFVTPYPCDAPRPNTAMLTTLPNRAAASSGFAGLSATGLGCFYLHSAMHLTLDLSGWTGAGFVRTAPRRLLDTRVQS
jgi:hypothetical protein